MHRPFPYGALPNYPHLTKYETIIWERFVEALPGRFQICYYDVTCGDCRGDEEGLKPEWKANRDYLGRYKVDVIGFKDGKHTLIELKRQATTKAIGELALYAHTLAEKFPAYAWTSPIIVTDEEMPNMKSYAEANGIKLTVLGPPLISLPENNKSDEAPGEPHKE